MPLRAVAVPADGTVRIATWIGCAFGVAFGSAALGGGLTGSVVLPFGPNGGLHFALDAVSALFLLVVCVSGAVAAMECAAPLLPVALGAMALALLAADGFTFVLAFGSASVAVWALEPASRSGLAAAACATLFLAAALLLLALPGAALDLRFAAIRAAPPEGADALAVLLLSVAGAGTRLAWPSRPGPVGALLSGGMAAVALYALLRVLFDLCGPAAPGWLGLPLLALGAAATVLGGLRASAEDHLLSILAAGRMGAAGLVAVGLGIALVARGSDVASMSALALAGALLHGAGYVVLDTLLVLCAVAASRGTGAETLSGLGGLIRSMPAVGLGAVVGAASLAGLPLTAGFAGRWLLVQSLLANQRLGGLALQAGRALVLAAVALGAALAAAAAVRLIGIGFLGRPRTPEAGAAVDAPRPVRLAIAAFAAASLLLGVWPWPALSLMQPALRRLLGAGYDGARLLVISPELNGRGYVAPGIAAVLALSGIALAWAVSRSGGRDARRVPAWDDSQAASPRLPFGAPAAQSAVQFALRYCGAAGQALLRGCGHLARRLDVMRWADMANSRFGRLKLAGSAGALLLVLVGLLLWVTW